MIQEERREFFAGSNSFYGFWSFFESIAPGPEMTRLLIKGAPGFGKSTLMKQIGEHFAREGYATEWFRCPSDPDSVDAVAVPQAGFCIIDATAPHAVMPKREKDEIVNLWEFWNPQRHAAGENGENTEQQEGIYEKWLHQTRRQWEQQEENWRQTLQNENLYQQLQFAITQQVQELEQRLFASAAPMEGAPLRHLFAAGFTPEGVVNLLPRLFGPEWQYIPVASAMQPAAEACMRELAASCERRGIRAEIYHSPADPRQIDLIALPPLKRAVIRPVSYGVDYRASMAENQVQQAQELYPLEECQSHLALTKAVDVQRITGHLSQRRHHHQRAEDHSRDAMNFAGIEASARAIIRRFEA